jgi:hypothetical protein
MRSPFSDGSFDPPVRQIALRAGHLTMVYESGMLRYLRCGDVEVVRAVYAAVRDHNWGTVPGVLRDEHIEVHSDSFAVRFISEHRHGAIHYIWHGVITGTADGVVQFTFDGESQSAFQRNRIGFCVLHPAEVAGAPLTVEHIDGTTESGIFPVRIMPHQPYRDIRALVYQPTSDVQVKVMFEGDTFEMEDQRNWTDASFKTYCTPLSLPFPVSVDRGDRVQQSTIVQLLTERPPSAPSADTITLQLDPDAVQPMPPIGLCRASHDEPPSPRQIARLRALRLSHLRVEVLLSTPSLEDVLIASWQEAAQIGAGRLEIAALVDGSADIRSQLNRLDEILHRHAVAATIIVLELSALVTSPQIIAEAVAVFGGREPNIRLGAGTRGFFTQINRQMPTPVPPLIAYALTPQVHAFDNASLVETLPMLGETVHSARDASHTAIAVTPITLKISWNPDATAQESPTLPDELPRRVDRRQMSLFGAGWTLGAIASLALARVDSMTFYETTGWLGVMERESGAPLPAQFPSIAGGVYPMYHVFVAIADMQPAVQIVGCISSRPGMVSGLALHNRHHLCLLIANHTGEVQTCAVSGVDGEWAVRTLDEAHVEMAMRDPENFPVQQGKLHATESRLSLDLPPYALIRLDQSHDIRISERQEQQ